MHRLKRLLDPVGALNLGEIDSRILRCEPEKSEDRRLRTGLQIQFFRGILQIGVAKHSWCYGSTRATA